MNREIKFRGQCAISKEMVYGDLIHGVSSKKGNVYILPNVRNLASVKHCDPLDGVRVIPETVGQYTDSEDKNQVETYEGDIYEYKQTIKNYDDDDCMNPRNAFIPKYETKTYRGIIEFKNGAFTRIPEDSEVIGNIHQNPELKTV